MQIACKRFGCQKAVEVCYWTCKYRRTCKDWKGALDGQPGRAAIQTRLEEAAARSGRPFDLATLVLPLRARRKPANPQPQAETEKKIFNKMNKRDNQESSEATAPQSNNQTASAKSAARPRKRGRQAVPAADGSVYLLLEKTGKYKEINESDLLAEAGRMLKDPSIRLIKGQLLVPQITLRPAK